MRNKPASSMQKTYDDAYLTCSTAVYFEGQNNEAEALRSWRSALDKIYYHNAYGVSANYAPKSETEKALQDSLRELEAQCKERVDLLEALKQSRKEMGKDDKKHSSGRHDNGRPKPERSKSSELFGDFGKGPSFIGGGTVPAVDYPDLARPGPPLPKRPVPPTNRSSESLVQKDNSQILTALPSLPAPVKPNSRSPSPDQRKTMLRTLRKDGKKRNSSSHSTQDKRRPERPAASKAAGLAWDSKPRPSFPNSVPDGPDSGSQTLFDASLLLPQSSNGRKSSEEPRRRTLNSPGLSDYIPNASWREPQYNRAAPPAAEKYSADSREEPYPNIQETASRPGSPPPVPIHSTSPRPAPEVEEKSSPAQSLLEGRNPFFSIPKSPPRLSKPPDLSYRREYPTNHAKQFSLPSLALRPGSASSHTSASAGLSRRPVAKPSLPHTGESKKVTQVDVSNSSGSGDEVPATPASTVSQADTATKSTKSPKAVRTKRKDGATPATPPSTDGESHGDHHAELSEWDRRVRKVMKNLPKGVDEQIARSILNEVVVQGDEVHWDDVSGLDVAKKALKEAVVYPFLRPDLFMGLREPARGMLLFGPPGTGKTMLAKAVATESKSTFFSISASSLTSKWHGESEKLVKALFSLAKALAPAIIFVDEIDSLLSARSSSSEHEASRRSKTEFLIQWSDLQRAAAGSNRDSDKSGGDASRVLVLAATNTPWDIDDAARRRFVRRQYIPLPEVATREKQLRNLLANQRHELSEEDVEVLVRVTDALAKDAAMGPLRNLGEALLFTPMDQIRPIRFEDFEASLETIRPSVDKDGLQQFENWARQFGERGG
ncbi:MAG: hypothetical protein Q9227_007901 [Pyrenula ochraceoflavens]